MRNLTPGLLLLCGVAAFQPTRAAEHGSVCREPSVVDEIVREIRARNYYASVDPTLVTEQWTADPSVVRCQVCVESAPYDSPMFGDRPVARCVGHDFDIQIEPRGFVVRDLQ